MALTTILFDLDGTLVDTKEGIVNSIQSGFRDLKLTVPSTKEIDPWIGPPLRSSFAKYLETSTKEKPTSEEVEKVLAAYRKHYGTTGVLQNAPFPYVETTLAALQARNYKLIVTTSKAPLFANKILDHVGILHYFNAVHGSPLDGSLDDKRELVKFAVKEEKLDPTHCLSIGDRKDDIIAAHFNSITAIGVTYGYGSREELVEYKADYLCDSMKSVLELIELGTFK